uniref:Uncharacterized mitochondrial protein AtMg00860-like n=1 Tax=Nicotiana tabacum TaxID=4097 RepID=A0A1S3XDL7_TOBAC
MAFSHHVVSSKGIKVDLKKIEAVQSWRRPPSATEIRSFLGLDRYYRRLVEGLSFIAASMTRLTQKGAHFIWYEECEDTVQHDDAKEVSISDDGVLQMQGRLCVPNVDGLHELFLEEAHCLR